MEICLIIFWWVASKWLARFVVLGLITKVIAKLKGKAVESVEKLKTDLRRDTEE
jgi:hypothetical protein